MADADTTRDQEPRRVPGSRRRGSAQKIAAERQRRKARAIWIGLAAGAVVVMVVAGIVLASRRQMEASVPAGIQSFDVTAGHSTDPVTYDQNPPAGGAHDPVWQNCGYYPAPVRDENAVHSLEHGAVWITYQPDLPQDQVATLRELAGTQSFILVSPMEGIPAPVVASAWGKQLLLDAADDEGLEQFVRSYRLSPEAPEPGASCSGGTAEMV